MIKVDLYCRVSSTEQAEEGYSLAEQEARLRAYAESQGWTVHACHVDPGFSGAKLERPGLQKVIEDAQQHRINRVVTYKLDRLSRSQKDTLYLIEDVFLKNSVDYVSMTESFDTGSPFGRAIIGILSVFAQLERENIAERMMMGRVASAKEGNWRGGSGVPIGYRYIPKSGNEPGQLVIDPYEANIVRTVFSMFLSGHTFHAIYDHCHKNFTTSYGSFAGGGANLIPAMLSNRAYIGDIKYCGIWYDGRHESIIDEDTFQRAQDRLVQYRATLDDHRRNPYQTGHLLTGFLFCGECGSRWCYHGCRYKRKSGETVIYGTYACYVKNSRKGMAKSEKCSIPVWNSDELENVVWSQLESIQYSDIDQQDDSSTQEIIALQDKLEQIDRQISRLVDLYSLGTISFDQISEKSTILQSQRQKLVEQIDVVRRRSSGSDPQLFTDTLATVKDIRANGSLDEQRNLLRILIKRIVLLPDRRIQIEWNI